MKFPSPIAICPSNGFIMYKEDFSAKELLEIDQYISSDSYQKLYADKHASYYLFYQLSQNVHMDENVSDWWLILNATWEAEGCGDAKKYNKYASEVIEKATLSLNTMETDNKDYFALKLLIPNLYRRMGNFEVAQEWLNKINENNLPNNLQKKNYIKLSIKLLTKAIEEKNSEKVAVRKPKGKAP